MFDSAIEAAAELRKIRFEGLHPYAGECLRRAFFVLGSCSIVAGLEQHQRKLPLSGKVLGYAAVQWRPYTQNLFIALQRAEIKIRTLNEAMYWLDLWFRCEEPDDPKGFVEAVQAGKALPLRKPLREQVDKLTWSKKPTDERANEDFKW